MRPNLLVAGAQKAGTTWLHVQLGRHPQIYMSRPKELGYFNSATKTANESAWLEYVEHFPDDHHSRWRGESTPHYFWHQGGSPFAPGRTHDPAACIADRLREDLTVILSLRDPVSRAISGYWHNFAMGRVDLSQSLFRLPTSMGVIDLGFYKRHWDHWVRVVGRDCMHVLLYDDLVADPQRFLSQALQAIGAEATPQYWKGLDLHERRHDRPWLATFKEKRRPIDPQEVAALLELYRDDIDFVEDLVRRSLDSWRDLDRLIRVHAPT